MQVVIPPPTPSQQKSLQARTVSAASSPSTNKASSSSKRPRKSSVSQDPKSIAVSRPRRSSSVNASARPSLAQTVSTPKSAKKAAAASTSKSTPNRRSGFGATTSASTPASSSKKRTSARDPDPEDSDVDWDRLADEAIDEIDFGKSEADSAASSDFEVSESEQPPPKKRAKQPAKPRTPAKKARKDSSIEAESSSKRKTPAKKTPAKKSPTKKSPAKEPASESPAKGKSETGSSKLASLLSPAHSAKRQKAAQRYFASSSNKAGPVIVGPSSLPVEDEATGFLAFGNDDEDESQEETTADEEQEEPQAGFDSDNSSDADEHEDDESTAIRLRAKTVNLPNGSQSKRTRKGKGRQQEMTVAQANIIDEDAETEAIDGASDTAPILSREALLDTIPYSNFTAVLDRESPNMIIKENKRKKARESLYFGLRHKETLVFLGIGHAQVLRGCAQIGGTIISAGDNAFSSANLYAPLCNALPVLKSVHASQYPGQTKDKSTSAPSAEADRSNDDIAALVAQDFDTIVKVTPLSSPITALGQVCPIGGLATPFSVPPSLELQNIHQLSTIKVLLHPDITEIIKKPKNVAANGSFATAGLSATHLPHKWQNALNRLSVSALSAAQHPQEESVVALIRGSKKVGKSTLSRMALERLLSLGRTVGGKVAYLELDLGQSDFGPPGMVALHVFGLEDTAHKAAQHGQDGEGDLAEQNRVAAATEEDAAAAEVIMEEEVPSPVTLPQKPAGSCITLGPSWCQPRVPLRAHFFGENSPRDDPETYVAAIHDLIEYFRSEVQEGQPDASGVHHRVPLIVNTQGWIKGLGADLAARIEPLLRPTHIFDVIPRGSPDAVPPPTRGQPWLDAEGAILGAGPEIVTLESVSQLEFVQGIFGQRDAVNANGFHHASDGVDEDHNGPGDGPSNPPRYITEVASKLAAAEARLLSMMSYLYAHNLAPAGLGQTAIQRTWDFSEPLVHRRPHVVDVQHGLKAGIRVLALGSSVPDSLKLMALNSSIVAIVVADPTTTLVDQEDTDNSENGKWKRAFDVGAANAHAGSTRCIGLGIVRSIDPAAGQIHLLTPLSTELLLQASQEGHIGLVKGALELPIWASLDFEAIKEARESRLDVAPASSGPSAEGGPLLAGMPRNQVPYLEWPHAGAGKGKGGNQGMANGSGPSGPLQLGSEKRRVRRNLMRKSQFA